MTTKAAADEVGRVAPGDDALALLPALESVHAIPKAYEAHEGAPWLRGQRPVNIEACEGSVIGQWL